MCGGGCEWRWPPRRGGRWEEREHAVRARASDGDEAAQLGLAVFAPCVSYVAMPAAMLLLVCGAQRKTLLPETMVTAAYNGDTRAVAAWLDAGGSVNAQTSLHPRDLGWTLLAKAADRGHETLLHMLLERGAATEQKHRHGLDRAHDGKSQWAGRSRAAARQCRSDCRPGRRFGGESSALDLAMNECHLERDDEPPKKNCDAVAQFLRRESAEKQVRGASMYTPLQTACSEGDVGTVTMLLAGGASVHDLGAGDESVQWTAAQAGHGAVLKLLLEAGASPEYGGEESRYPGPLVIAAQNGHASVVRVLMDYNANPDATSTLDGSPAVMMAALRGHDDIVHELLDRGKADPDLQQRSGGNALAVACHEDQLDIVLDLLHHGADPDQRLDDEQITPLMVAASKASTDVMAALLRYGASPELRDSNGHGPTVFARDRGRAVTKKLRELISTTRVDRTALAHTRATHRTTREEARQRRRVMQVRKDSSFAWGAKVLLTGLAVARPSLRLACVPASWPREGPCQSGTSWSRSQWGQAGLFGGENAHQ